MPEGAFYAFADVRSLYGSKYKDQELTTDDEIALWLLDAAHVATVAGTPFGAPGYLRFSYACSEEEIEQGIAAIRNCVSAAKAL
jgi:aspartate aminotransferase